MHNHDAKTPAKIGRLQTPTAEFRFIHGGILFAANLVTAAAAGITRLSLDRFDTSWMRILWRIAGSWLAAILALFLAFTATAG